MKIKNKMIAVIGPFPPPIHGMAKNLQIMKNDLEKICSVLAISTSPGGLKRGVFYHFIKAIRVFVGLVHLLLACIGGKIKAAYLSPDAGPGIIYTIFFVSILRVFKIKSYLHHRSFAYIDNERLLMRILCSISSGCANHIFLCDDMRNRFCMIYGEKYGGMVISNFHYTNPIKYENRIAGGGIVLGYLSNLSEEKGIVDAVEVCLLLKKNGLNIRLIIGGPAENEWASIYIDDVRNRYSQFIDYIGFVDANAKADFFKSIDIFLFPTKYKNEAQPNVLFEAISYGVPVISASRGCIVSDINENIGYVFSGNYVELAVNAIEFLYGSKESLETLKRNCLAYSSSEKINSEKQYSTLLEQLCSE